MRRRSLLASAAAVLSGVAAGCSRLQRADPLTVSGNGLSMTPVDDAAITDGQTYDVGPQGSDRHRFVARLVRDGTATVEAHEPPVPEGRDVLYDDAVYRLSFGVTGERTATAYHVTVNPTEGSVAADRTVRYGDLPAVDRRKLASFGMDDPGSLGVGTTLVYTDPQRERSALVPEPDRPVLVWGPDRRGRFAVRDAWDWELWTYRYSVEQVAPTAAAYGRRVRERYEFELSGLSPAERDIVDAAIEDPHAVRVDERPPPAFESLVDRFRRHDPVDGPGVAEGGGAYLVRYEGTGYRAVVHYVGTGGGN